APQFPVWIDRAGFAVKTANSRDRYVANGVMLCGYALGRHLLIVDKIRFPAGKRSPKPKWASSNRTGHHESRQSTRKPRPGGLAGFPGPRLRRQRRPAKAYRQRR